MADNLYRFISHSQEWLLTVPVPHCKRVVIILLHGFLDKAAVQSKIDRRARTNLLQISDGKFEMVRWYAHQTTASIDHPGGSISNTTAMRAHNAAVKTAYPRACCLVRTHCS